MEKTDPNKSERNKLLDSILPIVLDKGPSHTTMDHVASCLGMSKRTLYEIFGSKDDMLRNVLKHQHNLNLAHAREILATSSNMMEAIVRIIDMHKSVLSKIRPDFFRDMDERCRHLRPDYDSRNEEMNSHMTKIINEGIQQGIFRKDCDFEMNIRLLRIQIESIKRMEDYFPPEITVAQAFDSIGKGFLRNIATIKGIEYLNSLEK